VDNKSYNIRVPKRWARIAMIVGVTALIVAPLTAVATHSFDDVANTDTFHDDIAWLKDAAVTLGCNPPDNDLYCPDDVVDRGQMAAFMKRLAENQVVDAGMLAGEEASAYRTIVAADMDSGTVGSSVTEQTEVNSVTITAPASGVLVVSGSAFVNNITGAEAYIGLRPAVDGTLMSGGAGNAAFDVLAIAETASLGYTVAFEVAAGTHTVTQSASVLSILGVPIAGSFFYNVNHLTVEWHPEGSVTLTAAGGGDGEIGG
jgi:hypothetical protein